MSEETTTAAAAIEPTDQVARTEDIDWPDMAPFSVEGTVDHAISITAHVQHIMREALGGTIMTPVLMYYLPYHHLLTVTRYALERRASAEVLFNKVHELVPIGCSFEELALVYRGEFEFAARLIPAVVDALEAVNAVIAARNPPPAIAPAPRPVLVEDTIFEQVAGAGEIDPQLAAARQRADQAAAQEAAKPKAKGKSKGKTRSIADAGN